MCRGEVPTSFVRRPDGGGLADHQAPPSDRADPARLVGLARPQARSGRVGLLFIDLARVAGVSGPKDQDGPNDA